MSSIKTIKFCRSISRIKLSNFSKMKFDNKPFIHTQFSVNKIAYFQTMMNDNEIHLFLNENNFNRSQYEIINKNIPVLDIYIGKYD